MSRDLGQFLKENKKIFPPLFRAEKGGVDMPLWLQIVSCVFSIIGVLYTVFGGIVKPMLEKKKNAITTKNVAIAYTAEAPKVVWGHNHPVVEGKIEFLNNTNRIINVTKLELIDGKVEMQINDPKEILNLRVPPYGNHVEAFKFETPAPPKYVMSPTCKLRVHANDKVLEYDVSTNSHVAPY